MGFCGVVRDGRGEDERWRGGKTPFFFFFWFPFRQLKEEKKNEETRLLVLLTPCSSALTSALKKFGWRV